MMNQRITRMLRWKLRVGGSLDLRLKDSLDDFFEEMWPGLVIGFMVVVVFVDCIGHEK